MNSKGPGWKHKKRRQKRKHKRELRQESDTQGNAPKYTKTKERTRSEEKNRSPTGGGDLVTSHTRRAVKGTRGTSQDCTRVFLVKGAADALCNPETDVYGGAGGRAAGHTGLRGNPSHDAPEGLRPPAPASLQDKWAEGGPALGHKRSRVLEGAFVGFNFVEDIGNREEAEER